MHPWLGAFLAHVFRNFVQGVNAYIQEVIVFINQSHRFLGMSVDLNFFETGKFPDAMIDMGNKISWP